MRVKVKFDGKQKEIKLRNENNVEFMKNSHSRIVKSKKIYDRKKEKSNLKNETLDF